MIHGFYEDELAQCCKAPHAYGFESISAAIPFVRAESRHEMKVLALETRADLLQALVVFFILLKYHQSGYEEG